MYKFFNGTLNHEKGLICEVKAISEFFPYTEPQIGDYINLPLDANDLDQEVWVIEAVWLPPESYDGNDPYADNHKFRVLYVEYPYYDDLSKPILIDIMVRDVNREEVDD